MKEYKLKQISTWAKAEILAIEQTAANKKKLGKWLFLPAPPHRIFIVEKQRLADKLEGKLFELRESLKKSPKTKFTFPIAKKKRRNSMAELPCKNYFPLVFIHNFNFQQSFIIWQTTRSTLIFKPSGRSPRPAVENAFHSTILPIQKLLKMLLLSNALVLICYKNKEL